MSKEIPLVVLNYYQDIMDDECNACFEEPNPNIANRIRGNMFTQLEPLKERAIESGLDPSGVFANFRRTCDNCFGNGRPRPTLSDAKSCVIGMGMLGPDADST